MQRVFTDLLLLSLLMILVIGGAVLSRKVSQRKLTVLVKVGNTQISVETAKTPQQIERGLSNRGKVMGDGMMFYMPQPTKPSFWMKEMQFALDFIWINDDKVVDLDENVLPPKKDTPDSVLLRYTPSDTVTHVLEVPAGFVQQHGIKKGDTVLWQ